MIHMVHYRIGGDITERTVSFTNPDAAEIFRKVLDNSAIGISDAPYTTVHGKVTVMLELVFSERCDKIPAIKAIRAAFEGVGLTQGKQFVDAAPICLGFMEADKYQALKDDFASIAGYRITEKI